MKNMLNKKFIIASVIIIILCLIILINFKNKINLISLNDKNKQTLELTDGVSIEVNKIQNRKLYSVIKFTESDRINKIMCPNGFEIYGNNKINVGIDYVIEPEIDYEFQITKENEETITRVVREEYDHIPPQNAIIEFNTKNAETNQTICATVTHQDLEWGIDITACKYIINNSNEKIGEYSTSWDNATAFSSNSQNINITQSVLGTYYLHVLSVDIEGNRTETVSEKITFKGVVNYFYSTQFDMTIPSGWKASNKSGTYFWSPGMLYSTNTYNLSDISTLKFTINTRNSKGSNTKFILGVSTSSGSTSYVKSASKSVYVPQSSERTFTVALDVSDLTGNYYIISRIEADSGATYTMNLYRISGEN